MTAKPWEHKNSAKWRTVLTRARQLRLQQYTYAQIAKELSISVGAAYRAAADVPCPEMRGRINHNRRVLFHE